MSAIQSAVKNRKHVTSETFTHRTVSSKAFVLLLCLLNPARMILLCKMDTMFARRTTAPITLKHTFRARLGNRFSHLKCQGNWRLHSAVSGKMQQRRNWLVSTSLFTQICLKNSEDRTNAFCDTERISTFNEFTASNAVWEIKQLWDKFKILRAFKCEKVCSPIVVNKLWFNRISYNFLLSLKQVCCSSWILLWESFKTHKLELEVSSAQPVVKPELVTAAVRREEKRNVGFLVRNEHPSNMSSEWGYSLSKRSKRKCFCVHRRVNAAQVQPLKQWNEWSEQKFSSSALGQSLMPSQTSPRWMHLLVLWHWNMCLQVLVWLQILW